MCFGEQKPCFKQGKIVATCISMNSFPTMLSVVFNHQSHKSTGVFGKELTKRFLLFFLDPTINQPNAIENFITGAPIF